MPSHAIPMHCPSHPCLKQHEISAAPLGGRPGTGTSRCPLLTGEVEGRRLHPFPGKTVVLEKDSTRRGCLCHQLLSVLEPPGPCSKARWESKESQGKGKPPATDMATAKEHLSTKAPGPTARTVHMEWWSFPQGSSPQPGPSRRRYP